MTGSIALIYNPVAGKGKAAQLYNAIIEKFEKNNLQYTVYKTEYEGHAVNLANEAASQGFSAVVAAGGDGTCSEVMNGLLLHKKETQSCSSLFGVLPVGRGNDFAYGAGIPSDALDACDILIDPYTEPLDVGKITGGFFPDGRYFANGIGIGFDTVVGLNAAKHKRIQGALSYVAGVIDTLIDYPNAPAVELEYNGEKHSMKIQQLSILNGRRMGGLFYMAPEGNKSDGKLDLCAAVRPLSRREMIGAVVKYMSGMQDTLPYIKTALSSAFHITAPHGGLVCHADGETVCTDGYELTVECIPAPLNIICKQGLPEQLASRKGLSRS